MRFLHTSDWHLGQKLLFHDREREHQLALGWLSGIIRDREVEVLIVAGDVFEIGNPPNYARRMYYQFLTGLLSTRCRHVVITGGNHDSPSMLDAPRELLQALRMHVIGATPESPQEEVVELREASGNLEAVVAAVPFLRDRDLRYGVAGETGAERIRRIQEGIQNHYEKVGVLAGRYRKEKVPILATGHLYAKGATSSDVQDNIYIGDRENIAAEAFPSIFSYVALGHLHRAQVVGGQDHVRYCGSLIPLSFSETKDEKGVYLIDYDESRLKEVHFEAAPTFRRLKTIEGDLDEVKQKLRRFAEKKDRLLTPWVEILVKTDQLIPQLDVHLRTFAEDMDLEILKVRLDRTRYEALDDQVQVMDLHDMDVQEVFQKKCASYGAAPEEMTELEAAFRELQNWMKEAAQE